MESKESRLPSLIARADRFSDRIRHRLRKITGFIHPLMILPYLGYGTAEKVLLGGRVLEDEGFEPSGSSDRIWRNLVNTYRRFESDEVPGARVRARFHGGEAEAITDDEGYFQFAFAPARRAHAARWQKVELELVAPATGKPTARATARVLFPPASARLGVISDIDDTVIASNVSNKLRMILTAVLSNAQTRKPFAGVAGFYRALRNGAAGAEENPIFYISNSPWNLYPVLVEFLKLQRIPLGPLLLRDFGDHIFFSGERRGHKMSNIKMIMESFPHLPFVLIGDSGEQDPEIYREVVRQYPERVRAIYIRSIDRRAARLAAIEKLIEEVRHTRSQLVLAPDSEYAAAHAAGEGLISARALTAIRIEHEKDHDAPTQQALAR